MPALPQKNAIRLEQWLRRHVSASGATGNPSAIPPTRELGLRFGLSHATVHRLLRRLENEGLLWRADNGRCYATAVKRYVAPLRPMACLLRRLGGWSVLCREVMEGFSDACAEQNTPILLVHSRELLSQKNSHSPAILASAEMQKEILRDFLRVYAGKTGGLLLDEIWCDEAIESVKSELPHTVTFHTSSGVPGIGNTVADFEAGAVMGLGHLFMCGYQSVFFMDLFGTYKPAGLMLEQAQKARTRLGGEKKIETIKSEAGLKGVIAKISKTRRRTGFFCTDDFSALYLLKCLKAAKLDVPGRVGVISTMGTRVALENHLTTLCYDFREMGAQSARMLLDGNLKTIRFTPRLSAGKTTVG